MTKISETMDTQYRDQLISIFHSLQSNPTNEIISASNELVNQILKKSSSIYSCLSIILNPPDLYSQIQSLILFRRIFILYKSEFSEEVLYKFSEQFLNFLVEIHPNEIICNHIKHIFSQIVRRSNQQLILEFAYSVYQNDDLNLLPSALKLLKTIEIDTSEIQEYHRFFIDIIQKGIDKGFYVCSINFAFHFGELYLENINISENDETIAFLENLWNHIITIIPNFFEDERMLNYFQHEIACLIDSIYANPRIVIETLLPFIGNLNLSVSTQKILIDIIGTAINCSNAADYFEEEELIPMIFHQFYTLSGMLFNSEDPLSMSDADLFEDLCAAFSKSENFVEYLINNTDELCLNINTVPSVLLSFGYLIEFRNQYITEQLDYIVEIISKFISNESKLIRDSIAFLILKLSDEYNGEIDEYFEILSKSIFLSFNVEISQDMILALTHLFKASNDTDCIFEEAYNFLFNHLINSSEPIQQILFPCFSELCIHSNKLVKTYFKEIININYEFISNRNNLIDLSIDCLSQLSVSCRDIFQSEVNTFANFLINNFDNQQENIQVLSLESFGKLIQFHHKQIESLLSELLPKLILLGNKNLYEKYFEEFKYLDKIQELNEINETTFEIEEEDNNDKLSTYAIPALSLSLIGSISLHYPNILENNIKNIVEGIKIQSKLPIQDSMCITCKAMYLITKSIQLIPNYEKYNDFQESIQIFIDICLNMIRSTNEIEVSGESFNVLGEIVRVFKIEIFSNKFEELQILLRQFFEGKLICQENMFEYIEELFEPISNLICEIIYSIGADSVKYLNYILEILLNKLEDKDYEIRQFSLTILSQFIQDCSSELPEEILNKIYRVSINGLNKGDSVSVFTINQFTSGATEFLIPYSNELLELLYKKLTNKKFKSRKYNEFIDDIVALIGELQHHIFKDNFPIDVFLKPCLSNMPAKEDRSSNLDMMRFYVWLASKTNFQPIEDFGKVAIKLLCQPIEDIGGIAEDDSGILQDVIKILIEILKQIENPQNFISMVCEEDNFKVQRVLETINKFI